MFSYKKVNLTQAALQETLFDKTELYPYGFKTVNVAICLFAVNSFIFYFCNKCIWICRLVVFYVDNWPGQLSGGRVGHPLMRRLVMCFYDFYACSPLPLVYKCAGVYCKALWAVERPGKPYKNMLLIYQSRQQKHRLCRKSSDYKFRCPFHHLPLAYFNT